MFTVSVLGEAVGIQHQGIIDRSGTGASANGLNTAVFVGRFKRGRIDTPMLITKDTIRGRLGYDPENPDYQAVRDVLDKVPSVYVLRVGVSPSPIDPL
jgi:hypothetical protein